MAIAKLSQKQMAMGLNNLAFGTWFNANMRSTDVFVISAQGNGFNTIRPSVTQGLFCPMYPDITVAQPGGAKPLGGVGGPLGFSYVGIDAEIGNMPAAQIADLLTNVTISQQLARAWGCQNWVVCDLKTAQRWGAIIAPVTDNFYIQVQRYVQDIARTLNFIWQTGWQVRSINPTCKIWVQLQTDQAPFEYLIKQTLDVADYIDGISLSDNGGPSDILRAYVQTIRT